MLSASFDWRRDFTNTTSLVSNGQLSHLGLGLGGHRPFESNATCSSYSLKVWLYSNLETTSFNGYCDNFYRMSIFTKSVCWNKTIDTFGCKEWFLNSGSTLFFWLTNFSDPTLHFSIFPLVSLSEDPRLFNQCVPNSWCPETEMGTLKFSDHCWGNCINTLKNQYIQVDGVHPKIRHFKHILGCTFLKYR